MAGDSPYLVVVHQGKGSKDESASVNSMATRSSGTKTRPSSMVSNDSYTTDNTSMWSDKEAALIEGSKSRVNSRTGQTVTVWHGR
ncbi:unnamed protein product [Discula destructiva]